VLVAIVIGSSLAGLLGVVLAAPSVATIRLFGRYLRAKLLDEELFPAMSSYSIQQRGIIYRMIRFFLSKRFPVLPSNTSEDWSRTTSEMMVESRES
jgi:hypothetical protein